jgi:Icc protein
MAVTVLQVSDTHLTASPGERRGGRDPAARLGAVVAAWQDRGRRADAVLLTGDITDDASEAGCRRVAVQLARLDAPVLAVGGNHDAGPEITSVFGPARTLEVGGWRLIGVDSQQPGRVEGAVGPAEVLARIDGMDLRPTVLAVHHPPRGVSTHPWFQLEGGDELLDGLALRPQVRLVVSGHLHQPFEDRVGHLALLGAPSTLYALRHDGTAWDKDETVPTGARVLRLGDDGTWASELLIA